MLLFRGYGAFWFGRAGSPVAVVAPTNTPLLDGLEPDEQKQKNNLFIAIFTADLIASGLLDD